MPSERRGLPVQEPNNMSYCTFCGKSFARSEHLERHMLVHSNAKPFSCLQCNKSFSKRDMLKRHYDSHKIEEDTSSSRSKPKSNSTVKITESPRYFVTDRPQLSLYIPSNTDGIADVSKYLSSTAHPESSSSTCSSASSTYTDIALSPQPTTRPTLGWTSSPITTKQRPVQGVTRRTTNYPWMLETPR